ncbi:MAG: hypothetical protein JXR34_09960 [Bacteroidales bacterium]|nr:hypothetical protein [Bacteroidales bacterium]
MKKLFFALAAFLLISGYSFAQGCGDSGGDDGVKIIGFIQPEYQYQFVGDSVTSVMNGLKEPSSFYFRRARLGVSGSIPYDFSYYVIAEFSPSLGGPYILDAFVTYKRWAPYLKISFGQFKGAFGLELQTPCHGLYTINRSRVVNELASPFRDFGVMLLGSTGEKEIFGMDHGDIFSYMLTLTNGNGQNVYDDNTDKEFTGRLVFSPFEDIKIGGSMRYGRPNSITAGNPDGKKLRYGFDLSAKKKGFFLQGEYIYGYDEGTSMVGGGCGSTPTPVNGEFYKGGYWVALQYEISPAFHPIIKYQVYNTDGKTFVGEVSTPMEFQSQKEYILGFNYYFNDYTRFQANYVIYEDSYLSYGKGSFKSFGSGFFKSYLMLQAQVKFN